MNPSKRSDHAPQDHLPIIRLLRDAEDLRRLEEAAALDRHLVLAPNFVIEKAGQIVGYTGLNTLPLCQGWLHTERMGPRDSLIVFNAMENLARMQGIKALGFLTPSNGSFAPLLGRMGYQIVTDCKFGMKGI